MPRDMLAALVVSLVWIDQGNDVVEMRVEDDESHVVRYLEFFLCNFPVSLMRFWDQFSALCACKCEIKSLR